jgi:long-chain fatty acid transport protein
MNSTLHVVLRFVVATVTGFSGSRLLATGFRLPDQDAFATARGEAFVATADNPSAIYYNPAGITQLEGHNVRGGVYGISLEPNYRSPAGGDFENKQPRNAVPQLFYTFSPESSPLSYGLGIYSPYGLSVRWPQDTGFRTVGTEASIAYATVNPVIAVNLAPNFSLGAGVTVNYANVDLQQGLVWPNEHNDEFRFKGNGWDVGYNLGALWRVHEKVSLGASFHSATTVGFDGHTEFYNNVPFGPVPAFPKQRVDADADLPFPLNAVFGISYRPTPNWNFEFNADYTDWSRLRTVTIKQATPFPPLIPQNVPLTLNWESSWYYEFGGTRYLRNGWSVSAGYIFNENSVPDANYTPLVADLDRHFFSVGAGFKGEHFNFDATYQFGYGPTRTVSGSAPSATGQTADGRYEFFSHALLLTVGWRF